MTRRAVVICPGRGTYNATELGYLSRYHASQSDLMAKFDGLRAKAGREPITQLDQADSYRASKYTRGDVASPLIYAASVADARSLADDIDIVAVTGNSMGWYTALAVAGALSLKDGFRVVDTMGALMQEHLIGGQLVYPCWAEEWVPDTNRRAELLALIAEIDSRDGHFLGLSIDLGGTLVLAGDDTGLEAFETSVARVADRFPMRLANHAAFHTSLQSPVVQAGRAELTDVAVRQPVVPMIDGRGHIWWPEATDRDALWSYTLGAQVTQTYDFSAAIRSAAREFAPDLFIVAGPGATLGAAVAQSLIACTWRGMACKRDFEAEQASRGLLAAMGREDQRHLVSLPQIDASA